MELRKLDTFLYGDFKIIALNQNVFAIVRDLLDRESYVAVINLGPHNENISLKVFATIHNKLKVVAASPASDYEEG